MLLFRCGICLSLLLACSAIRAEPRVDFEVATQEGLAIDGAQRWQKLLVSVGVDGVRIRGMNADDQPKIFERGTKDRPSYQVVGILTAREKLVVPGATFTSRDIAGLRKYLAALRLDGEAGVTERKGAFGLTAKQLVSVNAELARPIDFATKGAKPAAVITQIAQGLKIQLVVAQNAAGALQQGDPCLDEVQGLTYGTGLAALLRPYGMVLRPHRPAGGEIQLVITPAQQGLEAWPIGWPGEKKDRELLPVLYEFLTVEIDGIEMSTALAALQERIKVPFLQDHNSLARHRVEPAKITVSVPTGRSYYRKILERVLLAGKLKLEVRVDEAGTPFVWITTIKK
jgi:hypothetical protein